MATSGSYDWSQNRDQLIKRAYVESGVLRPDETPEAEENALAADTLNSFLKSWMGDGLHLWRIKPAYLFLEKDKREYDLSASGDHFTEELNSTTISADEASGQTTLSVTASSGMAVSDVILIVQDDGTLHETTISSVPDSTSVVIGDALTDEASDGNHVYWYTAKAVRPLRIQQAVYHDASGNYDVRMYQISRDEFWSLSNKGTDSRPTQWYFDPQLGSSKLRIYGEPDDVADYLILLCHFPFEDMDAAADDFGFPVEWQDAIALYLAYRLAGQHGQNAQRRKELLGLAMDAKQRAMGWDEERASLYLMPDERWIDGR